MKLLPKQEVNKAKAQERKQEIDTGLALARKVDSLREIKVTEEQNLKKWREESIAAIKYEIGQYCEERENLKKQNYEARKIRQELLKPLNEEWLTINLAKEEIENRKKEILFQEKSIKEKHSEIDKEWEKLEKTDLRIRTKEQEIEKAKKETIDFRVLAENEYIKIHNERIEKSLEYDQKILGAKKLEKEYMVGISTNEIKAKILDEKESELIIREKELARQLRNLQLASEVIKNHGNRMSTNN